MALMHIKNLMQRGALCKGDVVIYKWLKEETQAKDFFAPLRMVEFFMGFMISQVKDGRIYDALGPFPQENVVAVFKPIMAVDKSLLVWKMSEERMCTETLSLLINRLLDVFPEAYLFQDETYFEVLRRRSLTHYDLVEVGAELMAQLEEGRDRGEGKDVVEKFTQIVTRHSPEGDPHRRR